MFKKFCHSGFQANGTIICIRSAGGCLVIAKPLDGSGLRLLLSTFRDSQCRITASGQNVETFGGENTLDGATEGSEGVTMGKPLWRATRSVVGPKGPEYEAIVSPIQETLKIS
jgi:hypothetical protein